MRIAIFASGEGTNFEVLASSKFKRGKIVLLVCDKPGAPVIERAQKHKITTYVYNGKIGKRSDNEAQILEVLKKEKVDAIFLAGFMRIIGRTLLDEYEGRIINIHPSLLPSFRGANAIEDAYNAGVKVMGITIHYVSEELDAGRIIDQSAIHIGDMNLKEITEKMHDLEHKLYPKAIKKYLEGEYEKSTVKCE